MGLCETVDPLAGSYYVETLTNQMRDEMERIIAATDAEGGIVSLVEQGIAQARVSAQAYAMQRKIESGEFPKVGVNCYRIDEEEHEVEFHPYNEADAEAQVAATEKIKAERDGTAVDAALARVRRDAEEGVNVMPAIVDAVKAYATVGEITHALVDVFGRYQEPIRF
jgi:methylmalonyl-CoA mutase N-terminal domain/subunit